MKTEEIQQHIADAKEEIASYGEVIDRKPQRRETAAHKRLAMLNIMLKNRYEEEKLEILRQVDMALSPEFMAEIEALDAKRARNTMLKEKTKQINIKMNQKAEENEREKLQARQDSVVTMKDYFEQKQSPEMSDQGKAIRDMVEKSTPKLVVTHLFVGHQSVATLDSVSVSRIEKVDVGYPPYRFFRVYHIDDRIAEYYNITDAHFKPADVIL